LLGNQVPLSDNNDQNETENFKERVEKAKQELRKKICLLITISFLLCATMFTVFFFLMS
jgi:hypothetical protein